MKKSTIIFLGIIILTLVSYKLINNRKQNSVQSPIRARHIYGNGQVMESYANGKPKTVYSEYNASTNYIHKREYYPDGTLKFEGTFVKDVPINVHTWQNDKGVCTKIMRYNQQGELHGYSQMYYNSGKIHKTLHYEHNKLIESIEYTASGNILSTKNYN